MRPLTSLDGDQVETADLKAPSQVGARTQRPRPPMSWPRRIIAAAFVLLVIAIVVASLRPHREPPMSVQITSVRQGAITRKVTAAGKLEAAASVKISANVSGELKELLVNEGDRVRKGQLLARIEAQRYAAQVKQHEAGRSSAAAELAGERVTIERLQQDLGRVERLARSGNASQAELERASADLRAEQAKARAAQERIAQADAALADARHLFSFATIYAPIDGIVVSRTKQVGERVRGSDLSEDPIVTIATLSSMEAKVEVGEREVVHIHEGDRAEVEVDAFPDRKFSAQVLEVAKSAHVKNPGTESEVTTFKVRLALTGSATGTLPGMSCQAAISTETHEKALVVPIQAVTVRPKRELEGKEVETVQPSVNGPLPSGNGPVRKEVMKKVVFVVEGPYRVLSRDLKDGSGVQEAKEGRSTERNP